MGRKNGVVCNTNMDGSIAAEFSINTIICAFAGGGGAGNFYATQWPLNSKSAAIS
jgi:hypothetical protein